MRTNMRAPPWKQTRTNAQPQWFYSRTSYLSQDPFLLFVGLMLVIRHLQKVLFAADEAHRASHPSDARAHTSKPIQHPSSRGCVLLSLPQSAADDFIPLTQASCARSGSGIAASVSRALEVCGAGAHTGSPQTAHSHRRFSPSLSACLSFYHSHTFAVMILRLVFQAVTQTEGGQIGVKVARQKGQKWPFTRIFPTAEVSEAIRSKSPGVFFGFLNDPQSQLMDQTTGLRADVAPALLTFKGNAFTFATPCWAIRKWWGWFAVYLFPVKGFASGIGICWWIN